MTDASCDVIVIGSGFGGAVSATRLAEAGLSVKVLERGPWRDTLPVESVGIEDRSALPRGFGIITRLLRSLGTNRGRLTPNKHGLFELFFGDGVDIVCSSGVGGGSHVYSGINVRPFVDNYWSGHTPELSNEVMEPHYQAVVKRLDSVTPMADHRLPNMSAARFKDSEILAPAPPPPDVKLGFLLPDDPDNPQEITNEHGIKRREVDYEGGDNGFLGSPSGGKTTLDFAYLAPAMGDTLEVRDLCEVTQIAIDQDSDRGRIYRVEYRSLKTNSKQTLTAPRVIVAAGTLNTLRILLHSRDAGLGGMPMLGEGFGTNGDFIGYWDYNEPGSNLNNGLPTAGGYQLRDDPDPPVLGGGGWPSVDSYPLPKRLRERIKRGSMMAGIGEDAMDGKVSYENGKLKVRYDRRGSPIFEKIERTVRAISERTGRRIYFRNKAVTVHPTGGARIADNIKKGVINATGEVFDHPGLYVADAAALPRAPGGPPSLTIGAWADHVASEIIRTTKD